MENNSQLAVQHPNYFAVLTTDILFCKNISDAARVFYGHLACLSNKEGYCYAKNSWFTKNLPNHPGTTTIKRYLKELKDNGFIKVYLITNLTDNNQVDQRRIYINQRVPAPTEEDLEHQKEVGPKTDGGVGPNMSGGQSEYGLDNSIKNNTINSNISVTSEKVTKKDDYFDKEKLKEQDFIDLIDYVNMISNKKYGYTKSAYLEIQKTLESGYTYEQLGVAYNKLYDIEHNNPRFNNLLQPYRAFKADIVDQYINRDIKSYEESKKPQKVLYRTETYYNKELGCNMTRTILVD